MLFLSSLSFTMWSYTSPFIKTKMIYGLFHWTIMLNYYFPTLGKIFGRLFWVAAIIIWHVDSNLRDLFLFFFSQCINYAVMRSLALPPQYKGLTPYLFLSSFRGGKVIFGYIYLSPLSIYPTCWRVYKHICGLKRWKWMLVSH